MRKSIIAAVAIGLMSASGAASAATITFDDILLGTGASVTSGGVTMTASTVGGSISNIASGTFAGLWLGTNVSTLGAYTLAFSQAIDSIQIEFDALSSIGTPPVETIFGFATNNGPISINYTNQSGTTFDGTTIASTANDGQGIIDFTGAGFVQFIFNHAQHPSQNGFVIERIVINTIGGGTEIPLPPAIGLFLVGAAGLTAMRRRRAV